jgi:hypothetical protein
MFIQNLGYSWNSEAGAGSAVMLRASGQDVEAALRREQPPENVLFDPQLYFLDLDISPDEHPDLIAKLATYPWFGIDAPEYESDEGTRRDWAAGIKGKVDKYWGKREDPTSDWAATVRDAVEFQVRLGTRAIVLPATLIADPETDLAGDLRRLDDAVEVARDITDVPLYASVPIEEGAVKHRDPRANSLVEALADAISARDGLAGAYVPLAQLSMPKDRITNRKVVSALLQLSRKLGRDAGLKVIMNFVDGLGALCVAAGATAYGTGYKQKSRRLSPIDYKTRKGGSPLPKFHSLSLFLDFYPERDLERLRDQKLLRYVVEDKTAAAAPLLAALRAGAKTSTVAPWEERKGNTPAAESHYAQVHGSYKSRFESFDDAVAWVQEAEAAWLYLQERFKEDPLDATEGAHLAPWRAAMEELAAEE